MRTLRQALVVGLMVAMTGSFAAAQTFTGGLRGAVRDANGVIPGVTVELINEATAHRAKRCRTSRANTASRAVPPGTYTVRADAHRVQDLREQGRSHRRPSSSSRSTSPSRSASCRRRSPSPARRRSSTRRTPRPARSSTRSSWRRCRAAAGRRSSSPSRCPPWWPRATRSSTASRIRPTPRCCRSAAAPAAATTT